MQIIYKLRSSILILPMHAFPALSDFPMTSNTCRLNSSIIFPNQWKVYSNWLNLNRSGPQEYSILSEEPLPVILPNPSVKNKYHIKILTKNKWDFHYILKIIWLCFICHISSHKDQGDVSPELDLSAHIYIWREVDHSSLLLKYMIVLSKFLSSAQ